MTFVLEKWYADCVTQGGSVIIAYAASLRWLGLYFCYSGTINDNGRASGRLRLGHQLDLNPDTRNWSFPVAQRTGRRYLRWEALQTALSLAPLLDLPQGRVEWSPLALAANVFEGSTPDPIGIGYLERLRLTLRPWHIGLHTLHWGRWIGRRHTLTWVQWEGRYPRRVALFDGQSVSLVAVDCAGVTLGNDAQLRFETAVECCGISWWMDGFSVLSATSLSSGCPSRRLRSRSPERLLNRRCGPPIVLGMRLGLPSRRFISPGRS